MDLVRSLAAGLARCAGSQRSLGGQHWRWGGAFVPAKISLAGYSEFFYFQF